MSKLKPKTEGRTRRHRNRLAFLTLLPCAFAPLAFSQTEELDAPEIAIQRLQTDITNTELQLSGSGLALDRQSNSAQKLTADTLYEEATRSFLKGNFSVCIRQLNSYLNLTQNPKPDKHLLAQHMLGFSYEQSGLKDRAVRAYMRYIEVQTTTADLDREKLIEVIRRTLELTATMPDYPASEKSKVFSAITGLTLSDLEKAELLLYAARNASFLISVEQAESWLLEARKLAVKRQDLVSRIDYELASIYSNAKRLDRAEERLTLIKTELKESQGELYELANLTLARLHFKAANPRLAVKFYEAITDKSPYYRTSLYERVFAYAEAKDSAQALSNAETYLQLFATSAEAPSLRGYLALLQLDANKMDDAQSNLQKAIDELLTFSSGLTEQSESRRGFDEPFLSEIIKRRIIPINANGLSMFVIQTSKSLDKLALNLEDTEQQLHRQLFALSQLDPYEIRPEWQVRAKQLSSLSLQTAGIAHKLVAVAQTFSGKNLGPLAQTQLKNSQERRRQLLSNLEGLRRQRKSWSEWKNFLTLAKELNSNLVKINETRAEIASVRFNAKADVALFTKLDNDLRRNQNLAAQTMASMRRLSQLKVKKMHHFAAYQEDIKLYRQYLDQLHDEYAIIDQALDRDDRYALRYAKNDFRVTWKHWQVLAQRIQSAYEDLDSDISKDLSKKSDALIGLYGNYEKLSDLHVLAASGFERLRAKKTPALYQELSNRTANELSRYRKWLADLAWLKANTLEDEKANLSRQLAVDFETIDGNVGSTQ